MAKPLMIGVERSLSFDNRCLFCRYLSVKQRNIKLSLLVTIMRKVVLILLMILAMLFLECIESNVNSNNFDVSKGKHDTNVTISKIRSNPSEFLGKKVVIRGVYMGWRGDESPPVTRSDWVIDDGTGKIYVTGIIPNLDPVKDIGKNITVVGYVRVIDGKPYIEAINIELGEN